MTSESTERLLEEMALVLLGLPELGNDDVCAMALLACHFRGADVAQHLDEARELARAVRADEAELWITRVQL